MFVIVPGIGMSPRYSRRLERALGEHGRVLSLELPGFGGTPKPASGAPMSVGDYAEEVSRRLERRGIDRTVLIGHSMGAQIAAELTRNRPALVERLVLAAPVVNPRRRSGWQQTADLLHDLVRESPSAAGLVIGDFLRTGPRWFLAELEQMLAYRLEDTMGALDVPVLVVRGSRDPISTREWCTGLAARGGSGRHREIRGAAHVLQHTAAGRLAAEITAFSRTEVS